MSVKSGFVTIGFGLCISLYAQSANAKDPVICHFGNTGVFQTKEQFRVWRLHQRSEEFRLFDENCDGILQNKERANYIAWLNSDIDLEVHLFEQRRRDGVATPTPDQRVSPPRQAGGWRSPQLILRETYADMKIFSDPVERKAAKGANFSYANDHIAHNSIWSAKGVAAIPFSWSNPLPSPSTALTPFLAGFAFTPSMSFQRVVNNNDKIAKKADVDVLTYGGGGEIAIGNIFDATTTHHFSGRANAVTNFDGAKRSWNAVAEYQPYTAFNRGLNLSAPSPFILPYWNIIVDPLARLHYAEKTGVIADPLFDQRDNPLRAGAAVNVALYSDQGEGTPVPRWLQRSLVTFSYSWLRDVQTGKNYENINTGIAFALDDKGDVAVKFSYEKGRIEETAQQIDLAKVGLTIRQ